MTIQVTPIPRLTALTTPAFTLGTANAAGDAITAVASNSTILAYDTTTPAAVAGTAVVGTATTAARRDHVHVGGTAATAPKAWCFYDGSSLSSPDLGVTAITHPTTGNYTVTYSTDFASNVYAVLLCPAQATVFGFMQTGTAAVGYTLLKAFTTNFSASDVAFQLAAFGEQ